MRVLHFAKSFSPLSETFIYDYVKELEQQGVENHVVTFNRENSESRPFPKVELIERPSRWHPRRLWYRALVPFGYGDTRTSDWAQIRERLGAVIREIQPDLVHAHFGPAGVLVSPVTEAHRIRLIVSFHGFDAFKLPKEEFWKEKYSELFSRVGSITVVSEVMSDHLAAIGAPPEKIRVVRVGKRVNDYPYRLPTSSVRDWISVGRLTEKKGFGDCVAAFQQLVAKYPGSTLDIIGEGERADDLKNQIDSIRLSDQVRLLGERPHDEVKRRLHRADGFVLCSKEAEDGNREGVPTVLMEAQAVGLPVVSTTHSGIPEVIPDKNHQFLATEGDVKKISGCMRQLANRTVEELQEVSKRGRRKIEREFNLSKEVDSLRSIYRIL